MKEVLSPQRNEEMEEEGESEAGIRQPCGSQGSLVATLSVVQNMWANSC